MKVSNKEISSKWIRPWDNEYPSDLYNRDDRFFSILVKGALAYLTNTIVLYGKPIRHFIFNTGSSFMYVETNGYEYSISEVTGEEYVYHERPRCVANMGGITINTEELTQPYVRGTYERFNKDHIEGYNAEIRRLPITMELQLQYVCSTFNEEIVLAQELLDKLVFQKYFSIVYLGQVIQCSIEFPASEQLELNKIDMSSPDNGNKLINVTLNIQTSYPIIDEDTEIPNSHIISGFVSALGCYHESTDMITDKTERTVE